VVESVSQRPGKEWRGLCLCLFPSFWVTGSIHDGANSGVATFLDIVADTLAGRSDAGMIKVTTSYQFIVRFRDGSRNVFDRATRGTLHLGERIHVIAGVNLPTDE
jgi:hypothetical protein